MGRVLTGALAGIAAAALVFVAVLYFADLEVVEQRENDVAPVQETLPPREERVEEREARPVVFGPGFRMPDLLGRPVDDARARLEGIGFEVEVIGQAGVVFPPGQAESELVVVKQTPAEGARGPFPAAALLIARCRDGTAEACAAVRPPNLPRPSRPPRAGDK